MMRILVAIFVFTPYLVFADLKNGEMEIREISNGVFLHTSYVQLQGIGYYPSNGLVVLNGKDAYIIDTPWPEEDTKTLADWISSQGFVLKASLSTHFHDDRSSGIGYLNSHQIQTFASTATNRLLESNGMETATTPFEGVDFSLLDGLIQVYYPGAGHTTDNYVVWLPESQLLFGGCLTREISAKTLGNIADASVSEWPTTMQNVIDKYQDIQLVVPGHGELGGFDLLTHTLDLAKQANANNSIQANAKVSAD